MGLAALILGKPKALPPGLKSSRFYSETFELWLQLHGFSPSSESGIRWEILWNNKRISIEGKPLTWISWQQHGITRIGDIIHPTEGRFLSHLELNDKFGLNSTFLDALQLRQSIPGAWRSIITPHGRPPDEAGLYLSVLPGMVLDLFSASPPSLYLALISALRKAIKAQPKWKDLFSDSLSSDSWPLLYRLPFKAVRETKMQALQFKILHRILPCRRYLKSIHVVPEDTCAFCLQTDTIVHFLYDCPGTYVFWNKIAAWLHQIGAPDISKLTVQEIVLGTTRVSTSASVLNFIIIFTKYFIQRQKLFFGGVLSLMEWLIELKKKLLAEKYICSLERKPARFAKWTKILRELG